MAQPADGTVLVATTIAFAQPSVPVNDEEVTEGDTSRSNVALVLNVGAGHEPGLPLLQALAERNQKLTFFVMGWWAERHQDVLRRIADGGHEIASHGHSVFDLPTVSDAAVREDLQAADAAISAVTGRSTKPLWSPSAGYRDARVRGIAAGRRLSADPLDAGQPGLDRMRPPSSLCTRGSWSARATAASWSCTSIVPQP